MKYGEAASYALLIASFVVDILSSQNGYSLYGHIVMTFMVLASVAVASFTYWRGAWILFLIGAGVGLIFEVVGVNFGLPFGSYVYVWPGPKIFGVPIPIIFAWGMYLYLCYIAAGVVRGWRRMFLASLYMVLLDMAIDPVMTGVGMWVWISPVGPKWHGIPLTNFVGWFVASLTMLAIYNIAFRDTLEISMPRSALLVYLLSFTPVLSAANESTVYPALTAFLGAAISTLIMYYLTVKYSSLG